MDTINNSYKLVIDNSEIIEGVFDFTPSTISPNNVLRLGADRNQGSDFDGFLDSTRLFDFKVNSSQLDELINLNTITLYVEPEEPIDTEPNNKVEVNLINSTTPTGTIVGTQAEFSLVLNERATCEFYLDNNFVYEFKDILGVTFTENVEKGEHDYFYYCYYIYNGTEYFTLEKKSFNLQIPDTTINFQFTGKDFSITDTQVYVTTPCLEEGRLSNSYIEGHEPYSSKYNPEGAYFQAVDNTGFASFNLTAEEHEFCLMTGRIVYNDEGTNTTSYTILDLEGVVELGTIKIPNQIESNYVIGLEQFDIYDKTNPKAWGQTWASIITGLLLAIVGALMLVVGARSEKGGGAVVIGGILIALALGFEINGLIGLVVGL